MLNFDELSENVRVILEEYLLLLNPSVPPETMLITVLMLASQMLCFNRVKVVSEELGIFGTFPNLYGVTFMSSGGGKDKPIQDLQNACEFFENSVNAKTRDYSDKKIKDVIKFAQDTITSKPSRDKYIRENQPRNIPFTFGSGTPEGVVALREQLQDAQFGSLHFSNSEFIDFIMAKDAAKTMLLDLLGEAYDNGNSSSKVIKSEDLNKAVKGVPQTFHVHSSLNGLVDDKQATSHLESFFGRKLARRALVAYPEVSFQEMNESWEEERERIKVAGIQKSLVTATMEELYKKTEYISRMGGDFIETKNIDVSEDAARAHYTYKQKCNNGTRGMEELHHETLISEMQGRPWKMIKLAGVIACLEHPDSLEITKKDIDCSVYIVDFFGEQFGRFYCKEHATLADKIFGFIARKGQATKTEIKRQYFCKGFARDIDNVINNELQGVCEGLGYILEEVVVKGGRAYKVSLEPAHSVAPDDLEVSFSQSAVNTIYDTTYKKKKVPFKDLGKEICSDQGYSAAIYKDNYRKQVNWLGGDSLLIFDIDNDGNKSLAMEEAKQIFGKFKCLIATTKSSGVVSDKNKEGRERYRVILPTKEVVGLTPQEYSIMKKNIINKFELEDYADAPASSDCARFYFGHKGETWYSKGELMINWELYNHPPEPEPVVAKDIIPIFEDNGKINYDNCSKPRNTLPEFISFDTTKGKMGIDQAKREVSHGKNLPCRCIMPGHDDKNPSAFLSLNDNDNLMFHCSACGVTLYDE